MQMNIVSNAQQNARCVALCYPQSNPSGYNHLGNWPARLRIIMRKLWARQLVSLTHEPFRFSPLLFDQKHSDSSWQQILHRLTYSFDTMFIWTPRIHSVGTIWRIPIYSSIPTKLVPPKTDFRHIYSPAGRSWESNWGKWLNSLFEKTNTRGKTNTGVGGTRKKKE